MRIVRPPREESTSQPGLVWQLLIVLANTDPLVWRRIRVPESYSFWDLHVAIQDAMEWEDRHLHEFTLFELETERVIRIGIPDDEFPDERPRRVPKVGRHNEDGALPGRFGCLGCSIAPYAEFDRPESHAVVS